jgi:uncharacterized protein YutE (UPF0331/DUF86 family)
LKLEEVISHLESLGNLDGNALARDFRDAWIAERGLQLAAEIVLDIGNHILSAHFGASAQDYEDIIAQLGTRHVIEQTLCDRLKGLGGFRNILVHGYLRIDPERVADNLAQAPTDFSEFARQIRVWLGSVEKD